MFSRTYAADNFRTDIEAIRADGSGHRTLATGTVARLSPDGGWLSFLGRAEERGTLERPDHAYWTHVIRTDGTDERVAVDDPCGVTQPAAGWSTDSRRLLVVCKGQR